MWHFKVTDKSYVKTYVGITGELLRKLIPKLKKKKKTLCLHRYFSIKIK